MQAPEDALLSALGFDPVSLDALVARTGIAPAWLQGRLLELELQGEVARLARRAVPAHRRRLIDAHG